MIVRDLLRALRVVRPAVCADATRYHMHGVLVDLDRRCVVATNGHQLAIVEGIEIDGPDNRGCVLLDFADVDALLKKCRRSKDTNVEITADSLTCGDGGSVSRTRRDADTFVPYWPMLERARNEKIAARESFGVNVQYLIDAHDGFAAYGVRYSVGRGKTARCEFTPVHTFHGDELGPIIITPHAREREYTPHKGEKTKVRCPLTWLVMPVRI